MVGIFMPGMVGQQPLFVVSSLFAGQRLDPSPQPGGGVDVKGSAAGLRNITINLGLIRFMTNTRRMV